MPDYRRLFVPGGTYFFTVVTYDRSPFLCEPTARSCLKSAILECQKRWPFENVASVLLPDHMHVVWTLPNGDSSYSKRWAWLKREFTVRWLATNDRQVDYTFQRRRTIWQPRFWEHAIRDERDFANHVDYIHYNPVKHGHATSPPAWPYSSFQRFVKAGWYDDNWGADPNDKYLPNFAAMSNTVGE